MQIGAPSVPGTGHRAVSRRPIAPASERRRGERFSWASQRPEVGVYLRRRREALGLTQEEVALAASTTLSSLRKWEAGQRNPGADSLVAWCRALDLPDWMLRKVTSLVLNGIDTLQVGTWPPTISTDDLDHLETIANPAYYFSYPHLDVLAANALARRMVPSLAPADHRSPRPRNLVEWVMTEPARELLVNWETVAIRLIFLLRVMGPGLVSQQRLDEIFTFCHTQSPREFTRFFATELTKAETNDDVVLLRHPITGDTVQCTYRFLRPVQPMRPYEQFQLARRSRP
ncbi:helix-turn-helix domain-containing protein [Nocardia sp. CDC159]|uniref:Helix-turn-helix domain-containing protein n=1 Tax=Nocardia pulmonis TaxID=2951408 RepID=A0A9X2ITN7_9NOCA|nr:MULTISPECIES: helix-turn-helix domain-containing protein [Nocardia]MCM6771982.1 helix-turn-helix domain-containing protein [Nocardia pulmonis]MCM6785360.1 helix-turn-helix domain-containing protein [Nocardia sp. CDC159]